MATGALDANGVWIYGEDDSNPTFSALLNRLGSSVSTQLGTLLGNLDIRQIVTGSTSTFTTNTTQTYVDTTLTATITPKSNTSRILVFVFHPSNGKASGATSSVQIRTMRGATEIGNSGDAIAYGVASDMRGIGYTDCFSDFPATTSAVVYKTQFRQPAATGVAAWVQTPVTAVSTSRIVLIEVSVA